MAQKWWMRCKNEQDMHHEDSQIAPVSDNAHYCITNKTLFELQGHTKIFIYIFIISLEMTVLHVTVGLLGPRVITWWVTSAMPNAKAHWTLFLFVFLAAMTEQQGKKKPNEKKQEEKRNQKNWGGGRPRAKLESRPTGSRCCLLLSKVCRVENVEKRRKREEGKKVADVTTLMGKELNDTRHGVCIQRKPSGTDAGSMETERDKTGKQVAHTFARSHTQRI